MNMPGKKPKAKTPAPYKITVKLNNYYTPVFDQIGWLFGEPGGKYVAKVEEYNSVLEYYSHSYRYSNGYGSTPDKALAHAKRNIAKAIAKRKYLASQERTVTITQKEVDTWQ